MSPSLIKVSNSFVRSTSNSVLSPNTLTATGRRPGLHGSTLTSKLEMPPAILVTLGHQGRRAEKGMAGRKCEVELHTTLLMLCKAQHLYPFYWQLGPALQHPAAQREDGQLPLLWVGV